MNDIDYWKECISQGADECGLVMTEEQLTDLSEAASSGHEHYGMAFYSPPSYERYDEIEREWKAKYDALRKEFDAYIGSSETAVKNLGRIHRDANVSIEPHGEVRRWS